MLPRRAAGVEAFLGRAQASARSAPAFECTATGCPTLNRTFDAEDDDWAAAADALRVGRDTDVVLLQKHEGSFYPWYKLLKMVHFLEARGPLGRLNARTCDAFGTSCGSMCVEELYLPNLYRLFGTADGHACDRTATSSPGSTGCRLWDGTTATRSRARRGRDALESVL